MDWTTMQKYRAEEDTLKVQLSGGRFHVLRGESFVALSSDTHKLDKGLRDRFVQWATFLKLNVINKSYNIQAHK